MRTYGLIVAGLLLVVVAGIFFIIPSHYSSYESSESSALIQIPIDDPLVDNSDTTQSIDEIIEPTEVSSPVVITHIDTPPIVKGVYVTEYSFASVDITRALLNLVDTTETNAFVIDILSDGSGLFVINENIAKARLALFHEKGVYLIARLVAFNDEQGGWYNPASRERWNTIKDISDRAIAAGFDEINYDYIRYPGPSEPDSTTPIEERTIAINDFFRFLKEDVRDAGEYPISLDIFGSTFIYPEARIGQRMEDAVLYFDYIMPMPYPSHWATGTFGYDSPGKYPYEIMNQALATGWAKVANNPNRIAQLRPWVQDFNLESVFPIRYLDYTPAMIHEQIYACYDNDCAGWVLWNPRNEYRPESLIIPERSITPPSPESTTTSTSITP